MASDNNAGSPVTCIVSCHGQLVCHTGSFSYPSAVAQQAGQGFQLKHNDPLAAAMLTTLFKSAGASSVAGAGAAAEEVKG